MNSKPNLANDIGTLTKIPSKVLDALTDKLNLCIGSIIHDAIIAKEPAVVINIGIGTLSINLGDMQSKFIPSKDLKTTIKNCLVDEVDPLELELEKTLTDKLINITTEALQYD